MVCLSLICIMSLLFFNLEPFSKYHILMISFLDHGSGSERTGGEFVIQRLVNKKIDFILGCSGGGGERLGGEVS